MYREDYSRSARVDEVGSILLRAADVLEIDGWCPVYFTRADGAHCVNGAIEKVAGFDYRAKVRLAAHLGLHTSETRQAGAALIFWNDDPSRTKSQVVAALRAAASLREG